MAENIINMSYEYRPVIGGSGTPLQNFPSPLERLVRHSSKLLDLLLKIWAPSHKTLCSPWCPMLSGASVQNSAHGKFQIYALFNYLNSKYSHHFKGRLTKKINALKQKIRISLLLNLFSKWNINYPQSP